ncbi:MAG: TlpA disulfide reductase family protein [Deltaproteobacteria bacterium]|nr:TlpA disulfide reductase family protein [Deltaproteobacteria bacterium]
MKLRNKSIALGCCLSLVIFFCAAPLLAAETEPKVGQTVGAVKFAKPISEDDAKYLGLAKAEEFTLKDVKSPYVYVEQFNTSCPHCMHQAPILNDLYNKVQQDAALKDKLKFMSVGQGNDEMGAKGWKVIQKVPFPVIPDPNSGLGKALNFSPYPVSMVLDKNGKILWVEIGAFESADDALKAIKAVVK